MVADMKDFRPGVFTLKCGEFVPCDFYLRKDWISD